MYRAIWGWCCPEHGWPEVDFPDDGKAFCLWNDCRVEVFLTNTVSNNYYAHLLRQDPADGGWFLWEPA